MEGGQGWDQDLPDAGQHVPSAGDYWTISSVCLKVSRMQQDAATESTPPFQVWGTGGTPIRAGFILLFSAVPFLVAPSVSVGP